MSESRCDCTGRSRRDDEERKRKRVKVRERVGFVVGRQGCNTFVS